MKRVLCAGVVTVCVLGAALGGPKFLPPTPEGCEPGAGPLEAGARLVKILEQGGPPRALVQVDLLSRTADADVVVSALEDPSAIPRRTVPMVQARLSRGHLHPVQFVMDLQAGKENHLYFLSQSRGADGSTNELVSYLRVNLDPSLEPTIVGDYAEYPAATEGGEP